MGIDPGPWMISKSEDSEWSEWTLEQNFKKYFWQSTSSLCCIFPSRVTSAWQLAQSSWHRSVYTWLRPRRTVTINCFHSCVYPKECSQLTFFTPFYHRAHSITKTRSLKDISKDILSTYVLTFHSFLSEKALILSYHDHIFKNSLYDLSLYLNKNFMGNNALVLTASRNWPGIAPKVSAFSRTRPNRPCDEDQCPCWFKNRVSPDVCVHFLNTSRFMDTTKWLVAQLAAKLPDLVAHYVNADKRATNPSERLPPGSDEPWIQSSGASISLGGSTRKKSIKIQWKKSCSTKTTPQLVCTKAHQPGLGVHRIRN